MTGFNQIDRGRRRTSILKVEDMPEFADRQAEILMDRSLVKEYINEYIQDIVMYNLSDMWILVIIHFMDGSERWGTIKKGDLCYKLFTENGFEWGGDWTTVKDYQHFELIEE